MLRNEGTIIKQSVSGRLIKVQGARKKGNAFLRHLMCSKFLMPPIKLIHLAGNIYTALRLLLQLRVKKLAWACSTEPKFQPHAKVLQRVAGKSSDLGSTISLCPQNSFLSTDFPLVRNTKLL